MPIRGRLWKGGGAFDKDLHSYLDGRGGACVVKAVASAWSAIVLYFPKGHS